MGIRRLFYIGGVIPTILGGGILGWWFGKDKTIEDALRRIGKVPFKTQTEFEEVYKKYKDSDGFKSNIPNAGSWESVSKWCKERLAFELSEKNIKEVLPKVLKYCTEFQETEIESKGLPGFSGLMSIISDNVKEGSVPRTSLFSFEYDGNYYCAYDVSVINDETQFTKCTKPSENYFLYVAPYKPLNKHGTSSKWKDMLGRYLKQNNPLGIKLVSTFARSRYDTSTRMLVEVEEKNNSQNQNALAAHCDTNLLRKTFTNKEEYEKGLNDFVTWCTETGLNDQSLEEFRSKRKNLG